MFNKSTNHCLVFIDLKIKEIKENVGYFSKEYWPLILWFAVMALLISASFLIESSVFILCFLGFFVVNFCIALVGVFVIGMIVILGIGIFTGTHMFCRWIADNCKLTKKIVAERKANKTEV